MKTAALLCLCLMNPRPARAKDLPVRFRRTGDLMDLRSLAAIPAAIKERVATGDEDGAVLSLAESSVTVRTCRDYLDALRRGFRPQSPTQISRASFFAARCQALAYLAKAAPSKQSYVGSYVFTEKSPAELSPCVGGMGGLLSADGRLEKALAAGSTWAQFDPQVKVATASPFALIFESGGAHISAEIAGWGDFDGDGVEDILAYTTTSAAGGSYRAYDYVILTRGPGQTSLRAVGGGRDARGCPVVPL